MNSYGVAAVARSPVRRSIGTSIVSVLATPPALRSVPARKAAVVPEAESAPVRRSMRWNTIPSGIGKPSAATGRPSSARVTKSFHT